MAGQIVGMERLNMYITKVNVISNKISTMKPLADYNQIRDRNSFLSKQHNNNNNELGQWSTLKLEPNVTLNVLRCATFRHRTLK